MERRAVSSRPVIHVLLVEDDPSDAFLVQGELNGVAPGSFEVLHVKNEAEAIAVLADRHFDVCLLDLSLPDATGLSALINIQERLPQMPVLLLTAMDDEQLAR
ncbi:MAG: response regulator, partial [Alphaproteobacteria bacterium]|nr:response regulator [Alphaproteobacteria bacterium]